MSTVLFKEIVFGPVQSRRLGVSLGINLLPVECKLCNFDCIYCECGRNTEHKNSLPAPHEVYNALEHRLTVMRQNETVPDSITFAGNGEPTVHPAFAEIIDNTVSLRNRHAPQSKVSVLSNATMLHRREVVDALKKIDMPIMKFDSAIDATVELINQPAKKTAVSKIIEQLQLLGNQCIVQTMFLKGVYCGHNIDNTAPAELDAWERAVLAISPQQVMIYTIARNTAVDTLYRISGDTLREIATRIEKHGISVQVAE